MNHKELTLSERQNMTKKLLKAISLVILSCSVQAMDSFTENDTHGKREENSPTRLSPKDLLPTKVIEFWHSEEKMKLYYDAICEIRGIFEDILIKEKYEFNSPFKDYKTPFCRQNRSLDGIFLQMDTFVGTYVDSLYTPLGKVMITMDDEEKISEEFIPSIRKRGMLKEASIEHYYLLTDQARPLGKKKKEGNICKIEKVGDIILPSSLENIVFDEVSLSEEQEKKDQELFKKLSGGTNQFNLPKKK